MTDYEPCLWCDGSGLGEDGEMCWGCDGTAVQEVAPLPQD